MGREGKGRQLTIQGCSPVTFAGIEIQWRIARDSNGEMYKSQNAYLVSVLDTYFKEAGEQALQFLKEAQNA